MRRFLTLVCLLCLTIPAGISITGCTRNPGANYCNGLGYGLQITDVDTVTLQPATTGISMAFGQTHQIGAPSAQTCKGTAASAGSYAYGTTNNKMVDISPAGNICAGTWNRNSSGGIANYTICSPPSPLPATNGLPYAAAYVTATAQGVTSNPVEVYVHAPLTSVSLVTTPTSGAAQACYSQGAEATLDAQVCYGTAQNELCAPASVSSSAYACPGGLASGVTAVPDCTEAIGTLNYAVGNSSTASILTNTTSNQVTITAGLPGTTVISASITQTGSSAGYFTTCPPQSISLALANGNTSGTISQGVTQNLITTVTDTNGAPITGLPMTYQSTDPMEISANSTGSITTTYPGAASITAICQPSACNASPINEIGLAGTGLPLTSNPVTITTPGTESDYVWFGAPNQSRYIVPVELIAGTVGSTVRLPYVPNSMKMDQLGDSIYLGSAQGLMMVSTLTGTVSGPVTSVPGVVLAVAPDNAVVLINDTVRQRFYLYNTSSGAVAGFNGMGSAAAWTPDSQTLYITDSASLGAGHSDTLNVYNPNTNWTTSDLTAATGGSESLAITVPSVGAYLSGSAGFSTVDHTWCPTGTVGDSGSILYYPQPSTDAVDVQTDVLAATTNGQHILGAAVTGGGVTLDDIGVTVPTTPCEITTTGTAPNQVQTLNALSTNPVLDAALTLDASKVAATAINQVMTSPQSNLAFLTYTADASNTNAELPYYIPGTNGAAGTVGYIPLTGGAAISAPLTGAFTPDDRYFFVSTAGDNMIHYISVPLVSSDPAGADTEQISPNLPACTPGTDVGCEYSGPSNVTVVPATAIAVKPRATT